MKPFIQFIAENAPTYHPDVVWHFTSSKVEKKIRDGGFKTGDELGVGELSGSVFATQIDTGVDYNRHGGKTVKIGIDISKMKIFDIQHMTSNEKYLHKVDYENGIIPDGYDAVKTYTPEHPDKIFEIAIKPEVATKYIIDKEKATQITQGVKSAKKAAIALKKADALAKETERKRRMWNPK